MPTLQQSAEAAVSSTTNTPGFHGLKSREAPLIWVFCVIAALRVLIFSAAFPFFGNVDEAQHFDLVMKYSLGRVPRSLNHNAPESAHYIAFYGSSEFLSEPSDLPGGLYPPPFWSQRSARHLRGATVSAPAEAAARDISAQERTARALARETNYETSQPPLYYALAGAWLRLGRLIGIPENGFLLYWLRFLNVFAAVALVWLGFSVARRTFPEQRYVRLGVPLLLAFFPQDTFYSIQNDVLSPVCFGAAFCGLIQWMQAEQPRLRLALFTGLALAGACLTKTANLPVLAVAGLTVLWQAGRIAKSGRLRTAAPAFAVLFLSVALPLAAWCAWNLHTFGDPTASAGKIQHLGWTTKPFSAWWPHPLFTFRGLYMFWSGLMATFWRGELTWHGAPMTRPVADAFYWISSALCLGLALVSLHPRFRSESDHLAPGKGLQRQTLWLSLGSFGAMLAFLAVLSLAFDFGQCVYPSRAFPFFASGRLMSAVLIPFLLLYCHSLNWLLDRLKGGRMRWIVLAGMAAMITFSEIAINFPAFSSPYNFFGMLNGD
jgi:hypothetical protein